MLTFAPRCYLIRAHRCFLATGGGRGCEGGRLNKSKHEASPTFLRKFTQFTSYFSGDNLVHKSGIELHVFYFSMVFTSGHRSFIHTRLEGLSNLPCSLPDVQQRKIFRAESCVSLCDSFHIFSVSADAVSADRRSSWECMIHSMCS